MPSRNIVIRSESHRNEEESKRNFSKVIEPWYVNWNDKDYGIDGLVQITSEIKDSADVLITGMLFGVQLKSTGKIKVTGDTICYTLETKKVNQFVSLNLPLLLVLFHTNTSFFYFRWMDESVVTELDKRNTNWAQQKTVTLTLPLENRLTNLALSGLKNHVSSFKVSPRRKIQPGEYFHLKDKALELVNDFASITSRFQFHSTLDASRRLSKEIEVCIYKIVVTGPSRVGKSTLINAFLGKAISPTGITQTTGVPLQFIPGESETVEIYFENRTKQKFPFSLSRITEFASQQENDENYKEVKLISVSSANKLLQNGISLFDIPGLDDASDKILDYSHTTLAKANAILYVIDGSPAEQGGFSFRKEFKKNILELGQSLDRIFLIINKLDVLSDERLTILKDDIKKSLDKYGLHDKVSQKIYYISAENRETSLSLDTIQHIEIDIWDFIINENKYGIIRLASINKEITKEIQRFSSILNAASMDAANRVQLLDLIKEVEKKVPALYRNAGQIVSESLKKINSMLDVRKHEILEALEKQLNAFPLPEPLPGKPQVVAFLVQEVNAAINIANIECRSSGLQLQESYDYWIEDNLKQIRTVLSGGTKQRTLDTTDIEQFEMPQVDLAGAVGLSIFSGILSLITMPEIIIPVIIISFIGDLFVSAQSRRAKRISKTMDSSRNIYNKCFEKLKTLYEESIIEHADLIKVHAKNRLDLYFYDLRTQLNNIRTNITNSELQLYESALVQLRELHKQIVFFDAELQSFKI